MFLISVIQFKVRYLQQVSSLLIEFSSMEEGIDNTSEELANQKTGLWIDKR